MEIVGDFYVEKIDGVCVRCERIGARPTLGSAGTGISAVIFETTESTPLVDFWASAAACGRVRLIVRKIT